MSELVIAVAGMTCGHRVNVVQGEIGKLHVILTATPSRRADLPAGLRSRTGR